MATVIITGATGLIGTALTKTLLIKGYTVIGFTCGGQQPSVNHPKLSFAKWNVEKGILDREALLAADHIVHLAGAGISDKRWSHGRKGAIYDSRIQSSRLLAKTLLENDNRLKSFVSASAIGWYGEDASITNPHPFIETDPPGHGFLSRTCKDWEECLKPLQGSKRVVILRQGIVFAKEGGAISKLLKPLRWGVAASPGSGRQIMSWISLHDLVRMYGVAIEQTTLNGVYNAVAPTVVSTGVLVKMLAASLTKHSIQARIPGWLLKVVLGELSMELLKSSTVSPAKICGSSFSFDHPDINSFLVSSLRTPCQEVNN
jgi:uncharacterized protein (TIGR01777 family)